MAQLAAVLAAVADEMQELAGLAEALQDGIGSLPIAFDDLAMEQIQALDMMTQRLSGLAGFLAGLASTIPDKVQAGIGDALQAMPLADMQSRLASRPVAAAEAGALELFGP